jgi:hypothetical protein
MNWHFFQVVQIFEISKKVKKYRKVVDFLRFLDELNKEQKSRVLKKNPANLKLKHETC